MLKIKNFDIAIKEQYFVWFLLTIALSIGIIGSGLNSMVVKQNGGKMPVYYDGYNISLDSDLHFVFTEPSQVKLHYLSDVYNIGNSIYSIGDFFIYVCICFLSIILVYECYYISKKLGKTIKKEDDKNKQNT